jgi:YfiH family protein
VSDHPIDGPIGLAAGAHVLFTARAAGNLSSRSGAAREQAASARARVRERLALRALTHTRQVHGARVRSLHGGGAQTTVEADGQVTAERGLGLIAFTADCLPVAVGGDGCVAMLHAGWRGLAAGVLEEGVRALRAIGNGGELAAVIGPGAGRCCYEVGEEVHAAFGDAYMHHTHLDLKAAARDRLEAAGVADVRDLELCTVCDERFFSHRREGALAGRQAGVAWLA